MSLNNVEKVSPIEPQGIVIENEGGLLRLYLQLLPPLRELEELCDRKEVWSKKVQEAKNTVGAAFVTPFVVGIHLTLMLAVPFVVLFLIVTNVAHTADGMSYFNVYDQWLENTAFGVWFLGKIELMINGGVLLGLLGLLVMLIVGCGLFPIVAFLFPAMLVVGVLWTIISVISAKATISSGNVELAQLEQQIDSKFNELVEPLAYVPPDYRYSAAVEHFCQSFNNGKASTLKEAVILFDNYVHQLKMEQGQQEIIEANRTVMMQLDAQSEQLRSLEKQVRNVKGKVDWMYWWS